jgi:protoporphyrinogen oxidase
MKKVFVLGGGLTGLVLAEQLQGQGFDVTILEKESIVGGMCKTKETSGVRYDLGPHKFASFEKEATDYFVDIVKRPIMVYKSSKIFMKGMHLRYPIRITEILSKMPMVGIRCGIGYMCAFLRLDGNTYEKYMKKRFGGYVYEMAFEGYAKKIWGDPKHLDAELAKTRMAASSLLDMLKGMLVDSGAHSFGNFFYCSGGIGDFINAIKDKAVSAGVKIFTDVSDIRIAPGSKEICFHTDTKGMSMSYDVLVSTIKPKDLSGMLKMDMAKKLDMFKSRDLRLFYYLIDKNKVNFDDTWRFFPEENIVFNRISKNWSPNMVPEGKICI